MHRMARESLDAVLATPGDVMAGEAVAILRFEHGGQKQAAYLFPTGQPILQREPYAEEEIVRRCQLQNEAKTVSLTVPPGFTTVEMAVAMNKFLLQQIFPEAKGKWIFTNLKSPSALWPTAFHNLELQFEMALEFTLTRTLIRADGKDAGRIFFSLLR
jgi:hypothetical protein